jgi:hypothetical protein
MAYKDSLWYTLSFGCEGVPVTTQFLAPGHMATTVAEAVITIPRASQISAVSVTARLAGGGGRVDTFTCRLNGVATAALATVTDPATIGTWAGAVAVTAGQRLSVLATIAGGSTINDVTVTILIQPFV